MKYFKKFRIFIKPYLIAFIIIFLPIIIIITSKHLFKNKEEHLDSITFEKDEENKIFLRKLESVDDDYYSDTDKICNRTSDSLKYYLQTGDTKFVDLYDFEGRTNPSGRVKDLMEAFSENKSSKFRDYTWDITIFVLLFVLMLLSIVGLITCTICCFCNCKCCDFCINKSCLLPCFAICTLMNLIIIICCIIGLCKTKSNFRGAANGECAILHFINEGINGESKESYPKWLGINGTIDMLNKTYSQLNSMTIQNEDINSLKDNFKKISLISKNQNKYKKNDLSYSNIDSEIENLFNNIHKTGKTLAYTFLCLILIVCIILQLLLIVYLFFSYGNSCIKIAIHIFWFIFALLMIVSFILAMYCSLLCKLGPDVVKIFTYVIGEQNLKSSSPIILNDTEILNVVLMGMEI